MAYKPWVKAEIMIMRQCAGSMTVAAIGQLIGRSRAAVRTKAGELRISMRLCGDYHQSVRYSQADVELARELHCAGLRVQEIAEKLELPFGAVKGYVYFERRVQA